jgi:D-3-phosphoglycerate dehydrogenase
MKVLFLDAVHEVLEQRLKRAGWSCDHDYACTYDELMLKINLYDGLVIRSRLRLDATVLAKAPSLKFIARSGSGLENIDVSFAKKTGIRVYSSPEGNRDAVGEHALGMLLMLLNHLKRADSEVRNGAWRREANRGTELAQRTVGIIGYGHMGSAFAEKLSGFNCRIVAYDKYKVIHPADQAVEQVTLAELQQEADVISLHIPLSEETHHFIDDAFIAGCSRSFVLINTARGRHVDSAALRRGLDSGAVSGACLDVLEHEQHSFEALSADADNEVVESLLNSDRVLFSPHIAGWTHESYFKLSNVLADKVLADFSK